MAQNDTPVKAPTMAAAVVITPDTPRGLPKEILAPLIQAQGVPVLLADTSAEALQKAKGKMLPFGWFHLLKALFIKKPKVLDLLLVGVKPEYQSKGVNALLFYDLVPVYQQMGFKYGESNPELEMNKKVQAQWGAFEAVQHKRRRAYKKMLVAGKKEEN